MVDSISIIMFAVPLVIAIVFSLLAIAPKAKDKSSDIFTGTMVSFFSAVVAAICWFIFGLTWPALATSELLVTVAYLWYAVGLIFVAIAIAVGVRMLHSPFEVKKAKLVLQQGTDESEED